MSDIHLHHGDCLDVLRTMPDNFVDSIVTDPPYGIRFMGNKWDYDVPEHAIWEECLRVLKPGGHLLAFAGTRTQHRMAVRIEDAGFEIRDMIAWVYGSGFPKSLDVSKAIDKYGAHAGMETRREIAMLIRGCGMKDCEIARMVGRNTRMVKFWRDGERNISPEDAEKLRAILPCRVPERAEREVVGRKKVIPGVAFSSTGRSEVDITEPATDSARQWEGWGTALKPALEPVTVARKPFKGTVAANVLAHGTGALNIDGCRVGAEGSRTNSSQPRAERNGFVKGFIEGTETVIRDQGRWPANLIHDGSDEILALFPDTGKSSGGGRKNGDKFGGGYSPPGTDVIGFGDNGSAARFFYCAKASRKDRNEGLEGIPSPQQNHHPTVKPTDLMRYLCRLVTPPGGVVLDPFMGSGSTGKAAVLEGFRFIGIEREAEYVAIAGGRIDRACRQRTAPTATIKQCGDFLHKHPDSF